jgi:hypothetical protein
VADTTLYPVLSEVSTPLPSHEHTAWNPLTYPINICWSPEIGQSYNLTLLNPHPQPLPHHNFQSHIKWPLIHYSNYNPALYYWLETNSLPNWSCSGLVESCRHSKW